jgi:hypothetical protein
VRCLLDSQPDLVARIERLQRDVFRTKCVAVVLFLCLAAGSLANRERHPKAAEANEFLLKDRAGNVVARLGQDGFGGTCLILSAKQNVSVASLCVQNDEGASLDLHNLKSESRATLTPGFNLYEPMSHSRPALVITEHGRVIDGISPNAIKMPD